MYSLLYTRTTVFAIVYFVLGMWNSIPVFWFMLNIKNKSASIASWAVVIVIITAALCLINVVFAKFNRFIKFFTIMSSVYKSKSVTIIILWILAAILGLIAPRIQSG